MIGTDSCNRTPPDKFPGADADERERQPMPGVRRRSVSELFLGARLFWGNHGAASLLVSFLVEIRPLALLRILRKDAAVDAANGDDGKGEQKGSC